MHAIKIDKEGEETKSTSDTPADLDQARWEEEIQLNTPAKAWDELQMLFEKRVKQFKRLDKIINLFKDDLNLARFKDSVPHIT